MTNLQNIVYKGVKLLIVNNIQFDNVRFFHIDPIVLSLTIVNKLDDYNDHYTKYEKQ